MAIPLRALSEAANPRATGVILAIDYGKKRLGLALSDEHRVTSRPFAIWTRTNRRSDLARLRELVRAERVRLILVGSPVHLDGSPSEMSQEAAAFAGRLEKSVGVRVEMVDERLSSWAANEILLANGGGRGRRETAGRNGTKRKAPLDDIAASIILLDYLDRAASGSRD